MIRKILLNPGPVTTTAGVKNAQVVPDICHREKEFGLVMKNVCEGLVRIARGDDRYVAVLFGGSGTAVMESVISSVVPPNKKLLVVNNGFYGERMIEIVGRYKIPCISIEMDLEILEDALKNMKTIACVAIVHHETTTGRLNPIKEVGKIVRKYNKMFIVDAVSSFGGIPFDIRKCKIDFMFSTANKCLQGLPGVSFVVCNKKKLEECKKYSRRTLYLDLYDQYKFFESKGQTRFTSPVQSIYALEKAIEEYFIEGRENRYKRFCENWEILKSGLESMRFKFLLKEKDQSKLLITVIEPNKSFDFELLHDLLYERGYTIYPGKIKNTFRIANFGDIHPLDIRRFLKVLKNVGERLV